MLAVLDKSTHAENLSQPLQIIKKQFKTAFILLTGFNGIFNATNKKDNIPFTNRLLIKSSFIQIPIPPSAYEFESLRVEFKKKIFEKNQPIEAYNSFTIKPNVSTVGYIIAFSRQKPLFSYFPDDKIRDFLGFN